MEALLSKCRKEDIDGIPEPLEIDYGTESIVCTWCKWKGSHILKVINQHVKKSVSHQKKRAHILGEDSTRNESQGSRDIRSYFSSNSYTGGSTISTSTLGVSTDNSTIILSSDDCDSCSCSSCCTSDYDDDESLTMGK